MRASAWNNSSYSSTGGGYGFLLRGAERDHELKREWKTVRLLLEEPDRWAEANIDKDSFWNRNVAELINQDIGVWLLERKFAPWTPDNPPIFELEHIVGNQFKVVAYSESGEDRSSTKNSGSRRRREHLLDSITREHILKGIELFNNGHPHAFADSTKFDLVIEGKAYPPKAIIGLAGVPLYGEPLHPNDFTGGAGSKCFRVLISSGFTIVPKASEFKPTEDREKLEQQTRELLELPDLPRPDGQESPKQVSRTVQVYERDPAVRAFVLRRAKGKCECCGEDAPFVDKEGFPFLEVHHIIFLAEEGPDVVENSIALCPNCHRECHHGERADKLQKGLRERCLELCRLC